VEGSNEDEEVSVHTAIGCVDRVSGHHRVRVDGTGRTAIRRADRDPDRPDMLEGIERFRVRLWPAGDDNDEELRLSAVTVRRAGC
jgi:hypothetical protein